MITYKLAKKLKDAGYKQPELYTPVDECRKEEGWRGEFKMVNKQLAYLPTLSELIDACGEEFNSLTKDVWECYGREDGAGKDHKWGACFRKVGTKNCGVCRDVSFTNVYGETAEEAVANLWLKLNE